MRSIQECFENSTGIRDFIKSGQIDEGLKDVLNYVKDKFKQAFNYLRGIVAKIGTYFVPVDAEGNVMPAISPLTAGQAYKDNVINKANTFVSLTNAGSRIVGFKSNPKDAAKLYGSGNSIQYWQKMISECETLYEKPINEVKLQNSDVSAKYNVLDTPGLKARIALHFKNKKLPPLLIWGAPGIGKTAILMSVLESMPNGSEYNLIVKTLSNETPDNFTLPKYIEINGQDKATDVPKTWLPVYKPTGDDAKDAELDAACGKGLLFIDELSRATQQVLNVILPLINERMFNGYKLGSGWVIITASNRMEDEMSGQSELGNALANRFAQVYYEPTVNSWREWASKQNYISPLLLEWLSLPESENMSGAKFFYMDPNEDIDSAGYTKLMCTPRAWTNAMRELAMFHETGTLEGFTIFDIPRDILACTLNQYIPAEAIDTFISFLEVIQSVGNFDEMVKSVWTGGRVSKIDKRKLSKISLPLAQLICSAHNNSLPTTEEFTNFCKWMVKQDSDQLTSYTLDVFKNVFLGTVRPDAWDGLFVIQKKMARWKEKGVYDSHMSAYETACSKLFSKWGLTGLADFPDYSEGVSIIRDKFKDIFRESTVDGKEGLG